MAGQQSLPPPQQHYAENLVFVGIAVPRENQIDMMRDDDWINHINGFLPVGSACARRTRMYAFIELNQMQISALLSNRPNSRMQFLVTVVRRLQLVDDPRGWWSGNICMQLVLANLKWIFDTAPNRSGERSKPRFYWLNVQQGIFQTSNQPTNQKNS